MKKIFTSLSFLFATLTVAMAAKSPGTPMDKVQPDSTTLTIQLIGDEHFSWFQTTDGILLVQEGNAYYIASTDNAGVLTNSGILAHNSEQRGQQEIEVIKQQNKEYFFKTSEAEAKSKAASAIP